MAAKLRLAQTNFSAGEFSPLMAARSDVKFYKNAAATLRNFRLHYQGGAAARFGLGYRATLAYSPAKLTDFVFNEEQFYWFSLADTTLEIFNSTGTLIQTSTAMAWTEAMRERLNFAKQGDVTLVLHPDLKTKKITRTGSTSFTIADFAFEADTSSGLKQPYFKFADPAMTLAVSTLAAAGGVANLVLSSPGAFSTSHVGSIVRKEQNQILITAVTGATAAAGTFIDTCSSTAATTDWDEAVFSPVRGYANSAVWFGDRLWLGGSKSHPIGLWGSRVGGYFNFDVGTAQPNEAIWENAPATLLSEIRHLLDFRHLLVCGDRSLMYVPSSPDSPITPSNIQIVRQQPFGISYVPPKDFDGAAAYVQNSGLVAREAFWVDVDQAYKTPPISGLASHLVDQPTAIAASYGGAEDQDEAYLLLVNGDGALSVFHSARDQEMAAWVPWATENGLFKSVAAAPGRIAALVERDLSSSTGVWTLEFFDETAAPLDCAERSTSTSTSTSGGRTFGGFTHLQGCTAVDVVSNGHYLGQHEVSTAGVITLGDDDPEVTEIEAGFGFEPTLRQMPADFEMPGGAARGLMKRKVRALVDVQGLTGLTVDGHDWLPEFQGDDFATESTGFTGIIQIDLDGIDREAQFDVVIPRGRKGTILGLTREIEVSE